MSKVVDMAARSNQAIQIEFVFERETKGAVRYQQVDASGSPINGDDALVGTMYVRKAKLPEGKVPKRWEIELKPIY